MVLSTTGTLLSVRATDLGVCDLGHEMNLTQPESHHR
jgi:hypothetical protein